MGFNDEKDLYLARKRDYLRSKLPTGKRLKAKIEADKIVDKQILLQKRENKSNEDKSLKSAWDDAMQTTMESMREQGKLNKIVL